MIDVRLDNTTFFAGGTICGTVACGSSEECKLIRAATLSAEWRTEGRGWKNKAAVSQVTLYFDQIQQSAQQPVTFSLDLPQEGPITYNGKLMRVIWEVRVDLDKRPVEKSALDQFADFLKYDSGEDKRPALPFVVLPR
ncbi:MAG: sporulation protein [Cyanobacteria bacterium P01_D01_bin.73]